MGLVLFERVPLLEKIPGRLVVAGRYERAVRKFVVGTVTFGRGRIFENLGGVVGCPSQQWRSLH